MGEVITKERPILFSGPMVRAILDGKKTQTRRSIKHQPFESKHKPGMWHHYAGPCTYTSNERREEITCKKTGKITTREYVMPMKNWMLERCPYGKVGDNLWVRETFVGLFAEHQANEGKFKYRADIELTEDQEGKDCMRELGYRWKPGIHMPRTACRIILEITEVRVQQLHKISDADVLAEGVDPIHIEKNEKFFHKNDCHALAYGELWDSINGKGAWASNPWVWAITFRRIEGAA